MNNYDEQKYEIKDFKVKINLSMMGDAYECSENLHHSINLMLGPIHPWRLPLEPPAHMNENELRNYLESTLYSFAKRLEGPECSGGIPMKICLNPPEYDKKKLNGIDEYGGKYVVKKVIDIEKNYGEPSFSISNALRKSFGKLALIFKDNIKMKSSSKKQKHELEEILEDWSYWISKRIKEGISEEYNLNWLEGRLESLLEEKRGGN